jgi:aldose 1-epimerase
VLELPAATRLLTDERMLPVGREPVAGTPFDFRAGAPIGALEIDAAFTDLARDPDGRARARLRCPDGAVVALWADGRYPYLEVFTGDGLAPGRARRGLGVEPMTCAPDAFRSGEGLVRLEPGQACSAAWGVGVS